MLKLLLALMVLLAYSNSLFVPFTFDDDHFIQQNPSVIGRAPISIHTARSLTLTTYRVDYAIFDEWLPALHGTNLAIHLLNVFFVLWLIRPLLGDLGGFIAAGIFGLHPLQVEAVTYLSGRSELLMTCFALLAIMCTRNAVARHSRLFYGLSGLCCLLSIMSKESGVISILLVCGYLVLQSRLSVTALASLIGLGIFLGAYRLATAQFVPSGRSLVMHDLYQNAQLWQYLGMVLVPVRLSIDHDPEMIPFSLVLFASFSSLATVYFMTKLDRRFLLPVLWIVVTLAPRFVVNIPEYLAEHHLYLPFVGISALCAIGVERLFQFKEHFAWS